MSDIAQNVVLYPEKLIQSGAAYLCGGCALIATAALGVRLILWDYQASLVTPAAHPVSTSRLY